MNFSYKFRVSWMIVAILLSACGAVTPAPTATGLPSHYYYPSVDESVLCPGIHPVKADIFNFFDGSILSVEANTRRIPALYMNAIATNTLEFVDDSEYTASAEVRIPADAENENAEINLQLIENYTEYHAEITWVLNPDAPDYGYIVTRFQDLRKLRRLFLLPRDDKWHKFSVTNEYRSSPKQRIIKSISVDDQTVQVNEAMGTLGKEWEKSFLMLMETNSKYTGCSPLFTFVGKSQWRNISVTRKDVK